MTRPKKFGRVYLSSIAVGSGEETPIEKDICVCPHKNAYISAVRHRAVLKFTLLGIVLLLALSSGCDGFVSRPHLALKRAFGVLPEPDGIGSAEFEAAMDKATRTFVRQGNRANLLVNGETLFPALFSDIRSARREILISTYIFYAGDDRIGSRLAELLIQKANEGVSVKFVYDAIGSYQLAGNRAINRMRDAGCKVRPFNPTVSWTILRFNNRCHAKLVVIDSRIGYTMGMNLTNKYYGGGREFDKWRDTAVRVVGPVVDDLRRAFLTIWNESGRGFGRHKVPFPFLDFAKDGITDALFGDPPWPPPKEPYEGAQSFEDGIPVRVLLTGPGWFSHEIYEAFLKAIVSAKTSIDITYGYFLPDHPTTKAILEAAARGVKIRIILPDRLDFYLTKKVSLECAAKLWRKGISMYSYRDGLLHSKTMVIDGVWSSIGSTNINGRSMFLNYECNVSVIDRSFASSLTTAFEDDLTRCRRLTLRDLRARNPIQYITNKALHFLKDQL